MTEIKFKRLSDDAILPTRAHKTDSGFDLYAAEDTIIEPGETKVIKTDVVVQLPENMEGQVRPRSGVTSKTKLRVQLGTIDNGFTAGIGIIVDNEEDYGVYDPVWFAKTLDSYRHRIDNINGGEMVQHNTFLIRGGDRVAQLVVQYLPQIDPVEAVEFDDRPRGSNGFGSTGV